MDNDNGESSHIRQRRQIQHARLPLLRSMGDDQMARWPPSGRENARSRYVSYVNQVPFARRKKPGSWVTVVVELVVVFAAIFAAVMAFVYADQLHVYITRLYAKIGVTEAQNLMSQHLLHGTPNQAEMDEAVHWLRRAAANGDPLAAYNLVVAHLKQHVRKTDLTMDDVTRLMEHANRSGVEEAGRFMEDCKIDNKCAWLAKSLSESR